TSGAFPHALADPTLGGQDKYPRQWKGHGRRSRWIFRSSGSRMESRRSRGDSFPNEATCDALVSQLSCRGAGTHDFFTQRRGRLEKAADARYDGRLGGSTEVALELRAGSQ